ncbi:MAG: oligopeptide/dipeptide ABC transporter ATP-binding protein [Acidimicrobiales bacterium]|jgi:oligopeptide transport system ATP-binding protein
MVSRSSSRPSSQPDALVRLEGVTKHFPVRTGRLLQRSSEVVHAVDDVTLDVVRGETVGLVGETGCGKSTLARCITRLVELTSGTVLIDGEDISRLSRRRLRPYRRRMQMIFQDPYSSLNPRRRVGSIIGDPFIIHEPKIGSDQRKERVQHLMELVGLNPEHYNRFPAEFSGGQRQRIGVARALALQPELIVADEPVSALDVSVRAQVINLLADLQEEFHLTYVFITHDLSVVRHVSDRVAVMYLGQIVEVAERDDLYNRPRHPYTKALQSAIPVPDPDEADRRTRTVLGGDVPSPVDPPSGCRFHPRCPKAQARCAEEVPVLEPRLGDSFGHTVACHFPLSDGEKLPEAPPPGVADIASLGRPGTGTRGGGQSAIPRGTS